MFEEWKEISFNTAYEVSNLGRVKNRNTGKVLAERDNGHGYKIISFYYGDNGRTYYIHRLVAGEFIPNPLNKPEVNHLDGNKGNNQVNNLEWCTRPENSKHAYKTGLIKKSEKQIRIATEIINRVNSDPIKKAETRRKIIATNSKKSSREYMINSSNQFKPLKCVELNRIFLNCRRVEEKLGIKRYTAHKIFQKPNMVCGGYHWQVIKKHRFNNYGKS